ncbi:hypothetical protein ASPWEDRAFT_88119, partial [Aspergillus wentii DTO 134E9]
FIPFYMPPHSSHKLQPLDVGCFALLKQLYGQQISDAIQNGVKFINKVNFLYHYQCVRHRAFSTANILSSFRVAGLIPYNPERVLLKLQIKPKTLTP